MATLSAFADEIAPDLKTQMDVCQANGVMCIDVRAIDGTNVSKFTVEQAKAYRRQMADGGFSVPCIGSPLGKIRIDEDLPGHLDLTKHCCQIAHAFGAPYIRMFSFYPPQGGSIADHRQKVMDMLAKMAEIGRDAGIVMMHENEKGIYGAKPDGVLDIFRTVQSDYLRGIFDPANYVEEGVAPFTDGWQKARQAAMASLSTPARIIAPICVRPRTRASAAKMARPSTMMNRR